MAIWVWILGEDKVDIEIGSFQYIDDKTMELDEHSFPPSSVYKLRKESCVTQNFKSQENKKE